MKEFLGFVFVFLSGLASGLIIVTMNETLPEPKPLIVSKEECFALQKNVADNWDRTAFKKSNTFLIYIYEPEEIRWHGNLCKYLAHYQTGPEVEVVERRDLERANEFIIQNAHIYTDRVEFESEGEFYQ